MDERCKAMARAILSSGRSFAEAAEVTGLPVATIMQEWDGAPHPELPSATPTSFTSPSDRS